MTAGILHRYASPHSCVKDFRSLLKNRNEGIGVLAPFYVYISKSKNGWQYLDSLGGAAYTSAKEEYVEHPFLVTQTAMHHTGANNRNEVDYE